MLSIDISCFQESQKNILQERFLLKNEECFSKFLLAKLMEVVGGGGNIHIF